jgi:hypothetical protein
VDQKQESENKSENGAGGIESSSTESSKDTGKAMKEQEKDNAEASNKASIAAPEKPPRRVSTEKEPAKKLYEAPQQAPAVPKSPREPGQEPPLSIEIVKTPKDSASSPMLSVGETPKAGTGSGGKDSSPQRKKSQISPAAGFAYGLGGPLGKPAYGIKPTHHGEPDDPWPPTPAPRVRSTSVSEIKEAVKGFTARQWTTLIIFGLADLFSAMIIALQAPFYPPEVINYNLLTGCKVNTRTGNVEIDCNIFILFRLKLKGLQQRSMGLCLACLS